MIELSLVIVLCSFSHYISMHLSTVYLANKDYLNPTDARFCQLFPFFPHYETTLLASVAEHIKDDLVRIIIYMMDLRWMWLLFRNLCVSWFCQNQLSNHENALLFSRLFMLFLTNREEGGKKVSMFSLFFSC